MNNKYFKATLIDHTDEDAIYNTFSCYLCAIVLLIAVIINQWDWNWISVIAMIGICTILYCVGYRLGCNIQQKKSKYISKKKLN